VRIGIVNDLPLAVAALRSALKFRPQHEIAWIATNGEEAIENCRRARPDLILMDLLMPVMNGVEATRRIMAETPCAILVVTFSITDNVSKVFEAMGAGALDAVDTPAFRSDGPHESGPLLAKIDMMERLLNNSGKRLPDLPESRLPPRSRSRLVGIGASAGGPGALASVLKLLPRDFPAAVVVIQHVDEQFAKPLARWLEAQSTLPVRAATEGSVPVIGEVLVAAKNDHLVFTDSQRLAYRAEPADTFYRPSVDSFFESLTRHWKGEAAGVLLTGMGRDGAQGLLQLRKAGFYTIAQDEASSAVYGMPKAAAQLGAASEILPLEKIAEALERWCFTRWSPPSNS
jgi:two-component system response regulator WspF